MKSIVRNFLLIPVLVIGILTLENCCYDDDCCYGDCDPQREWGLKAVYSNDLDDIIALEQPRSLVNPSKIYLYRQYLLVNEAQKGIHIFDNSDPRNPLPLHFLKILGGNDVAIKDDVLYADQFDNLVSISLASVADKLEKERLEDVFRNFNAYDVRPEESEVYYECPDPALGTVIDWVADSVDYPCYTY
ncbi:MAG: hypothetical protein AAF616_10085 [Bacteroidota bacterium]